MWCEYGERVGGIPGTVMIGDWIGEVGENRAGDWIGEDGEDTAGDWQKWKVEGRQESQGRAERAKATPGSRQQQPQR